MKLRQTFRSLALLLCIFALLVAQMFGSKAGYYCLCGGSPVPTQVAHCYGPHGEQCAEEEARGDASHHDEGNGDRRDHQVVNEDVQLRPMEATPQITAPQVLLSILPLAELFVARHEVSVPVRYSTDFGESPPFGVTVAHTIVLRI